MKVKAEVGKYLAGSIAAVRKLGLRKPGDLHEHTGGPTGVMERLKDEPALRIKLLEPALSEKAAKNADRLQLEAAALFYQNALDADAIDKGRMEEIISPEEQVRIYPAEDVEAYIRRGDWARKPEDDTVVQALAARIRLAVNHGLANADDVYRRFRPHLAECVPRDELAKVIEAGGSKILTNKVLYDVLDLDVVVASVPRSETLALLDWIAEENGVIKPKPAVSEEPVDVQTTDEAGAVADADNIQDDDLVPVGDPDSGWKPAEPAVSAASPADDGEPEITTTPASPGETAEIATAAPELVLDDADGTSASPPPAGAPAKPDWRSTR